MNMKRFFQFTMILMLTTILVACNDSKETPSDSETNKDISFGLINWPENIAVNNVWKVLLEEKGYNVELKQLEMGIIMEALKTGDLDVGIEVWLPVQDIHYYEQYKDSVDFNETPWFKNGKVGLAVPSYVEEVNSVNDLNEHKDLFDGNIIGFEPGAGTMETVELLIEDYNLDYELLPSSEGAMLGALKDAINKEEPILIPIWQPHGIFSEVDLKFIEDPKKTFGEIEEIFLAKREGFSTDNPEVNKWLSNWSVDDDETMAELINFVNESDNHLDGAKKWVEENRELTDEWTK